MYMSKIGTAACALGVVLCVNANAFAVDLSLDDVVDKIMDQSQDLKKADANVKKAQAQLDAVNANRWININATATYMNMINVENPTKSTELPPEFGGIIQTVLKDDTATISIPDNIFMAGLSATQPIYTFGKIGHAVDSVRSAVKISKSSRDLTQREVRYSAINMYWTAKMTDQIVVLAKSDLDAARNARRKLGAAGRASRSNLVKIESDIAAKEINLSDAEFNRDTAYRMLKILAGIDVDEKITLTDDFPTKFKKIDITTLKSNPEWDILGQQVHMYESKSKSARAEYLPTLAATGSYNYIAMGTEYDNMFEKKGGQSASVGLALQMPIFTGGLHRANATVAAMEAESARQDLDKSKKLKTEEYDNAIKKYNHLRDNLSNLQNARDLADKAYKFSVQRFEAGQTSAVELAEVSAGLYQLDIALLNAKYNILMSEQTVKKLGE